MRILLVFMVATLAGCATREQVSKRNADMDIANYGPGCERLGLKPKTPEWAACVSQYASKVR